MKYQKIKFPIDGLPHNTVIEWWYFNGHLTDREGNDYAFMDSFFKADPKKVNLPFFRKIPLKNIYFSHSSLSDVNKNKFYSDINPLCLVSRDSFSKSSFFVNYTFPSLKGYLNYEIKEIGKFKYRIKSQFFDLILTSAKKPLLVGGKGFLKFHSRSTHYYSLTHFKTEGYVIVDGRYIKVRGKSWMDHQWADAPYQQDKWTWFSIQLENNNEITCFEYEWKNKKYRLASIIDGNNKVFNFTDVTLTPLDVYWESEETGAKYPLAWEIEIPSKKIRLFTTPLVKEQEMIFGTINYWEGPLDIKGKWNGKEISGKGFLELVGCPIKKSLIRIFETEFKKKIVELKYWVLKKS